MTEQVHANLEDLKRLQKAVIASQQEVNDAMKKLNRAFTSADWKDRRRQEFEGHLRNASSNVNAATKHLEALEPILRKEVQALQAYLGR